MGVETPCWWAFVQDVEPGSSPSAWLVAWLPKGHRHVWLARRVDDGSGPDAVWLVVDPASHGLLVPVTLTSADFVAHHVGQGHTAVRLPIRYEPGRAYWRGWMTCVAVAKYLTGLRWPLVWTPGGLIRAAEREGFEVIRPCSTAK